MSPRGSKPVANKWIVTLSVTFGTLMGTIDASIVNVALPHIRGSVGATLDEITWITTGFVVASVIVMPLTGFLGRQFGQKRVYLAALAIFIVGSVLCGTAHTLATLVAFRVLQGLGAGALQPTEQAILRQTFPPEEQGMAMALFGMAVVLGPAAGPTLGGYIVDHYSWPWIFYINVPVGLLGLVMVTTFVHEDEEIRHANRALAERQRRQLDWAGIVLLCVGLSTLQYVLEEGARDDWFQSATISVCLGIAVVALASFILRELTAPAPAVDLRLFQDRSFLSASLIGAVQFAMLMANMFLLPVFMQELLGYTALQSGLTMLPRTAVMLVMNPIVGSLYGRISARLVVGNGIVWVSAGSFLMSRFTFATGDGAIIAGIVLQGIGFSCLFAPLTAAALTSIPKHRVADATGLNSLMRQLGGSTGLAVFATLLTRFATQARAALSVHVNPFRPEVVERLDRIERGLAGRGLDLVSAKAAASRALAGTVARQATMLGFRKDFFLAGVVFLCVLPLLVFLKGHRFNRPAPQRRIRSHGMESKDEKTSHLTPLRGADEAAPPAAARSRWKPFLILGAVVAASLLVIGGYLLVTANLESTDDAQVEADVVPVSARVSGQVLKRVVEDNQPVKKGDLLVEIDDADYAARAKQAEGELETASAQAAAADAQVRIVDASARGGFTTARASFSGSSAGVASAEAQLAAARAGFDRARADAQKSELDLGRTKELVAASAASQERLDNAQAARDAAQAALAQASAQVAAAEDQRRLAASRVHEAKGRLDQSAPVDAQIAAARANAELAHARVKVAQGALELAKLQLSYTRVVAPEDGVVSKVSVQAGQTIQVGQPLADLVPRRTYVIANFKETQVGRMRPGQRAKVRIDAFSGIEIDAKVESVSGGTGARFSLLPPDNASGNFVKVVQRVPVRIGWITPPNLALQAGLSCDVTVDVRKR